MPSLSTIAKNIMWLPLVSIFLAVLAIIWLPIIAKSVLDRWLLRQPRISFGPTPSINSIDYAECVRQQGLHARTIFYGVDAIVNPSTVDLYIDISRYPRVVRPLIYFFTFIYAICSFDVFFFWFNVEGFLFQTPLRYLEYPLLKWFGKKIVCAPYGGDVQRYERMPESIRSFYRDLDRDRRVAKNVAHTARWSDFKITCGDCFAHMPYDICVTFHAQDLRNLIPQYPIPSNEHTLRVVHATGHPHLKGTELIHNACKELQREGFDVQFVFVHGQRNDHARRLYETADIVVDQLLLGCHGLFGSEALAIGKPVVCYLSEEAVRANPTYSLSPIVNANTVTIKDRLRELIVDPDLRANLGHRGRVFSERYHSYEFVGLLFSSIFLHVWSRHPAPDISKLIASRQLI